jgi:endonuclease/exonuclease/phosphatase family metal-dependent hydrolase
VRIGGQRVPWPVAVGVLLVVIVVALVRQWHHAPGGAPAGASGGATAGGPAPGGTVAGSSSGRGGGARASKTGDPIPEPGSLRADVAGAPAPAPGTVRIGAWNLEWLGTANQRGSDAKGVERSPHDLAVMIMLLGADVLGVEEVKGVPGGGELRNPILDGVMSELKGMTGAEWRYRIFPNRRNLNDQCCGVVWNTARLTAGAFTALEVDESLATTTDHGFLVRRPVLAQFSAGAGKTDFGLVVIHLKCCDEREQRAAEARAIVKGLTPLMKALREGDVLIIGDSNMNRHDEPGVVELARAGFADLNAQDAGTYIAGGGALDRAFTPPGPGGKGTQPEFAGSTFNVYRYPGLTDWQQRVMLSDHRPVYVDVKVMADDD